MCSQTLLPGVLANPEAVATPRFAPVSAKLSFGQGSGARTAFELSYQGNQVTGFMASRKEPSKRREIDENASDDTVDQRIDWAAVMALKEYVEGKEFQFHVYNPGTGNSVVSGRIGKSETTAVPAGSFETVRVSYRIDKRGRSETYEVFVTKQAPRFLVKEKFPNGSAVELESLPNQHPICPKFAWGPWRSQLTGFRLTDIRTW